MAYYKGTSGTFFVETRSLETGLPVTVDASTVSMAVYKRTGTPVSWESGVDYEITSITGGLMVYVEDFGSQDSISFFFSCTDSSVYIPMVCIELSDDIAAALDDISNEVQNAAKTTDIPSLESIADAVLTTQFGTYQLKAESGAYSTIPLTVEFAASLAAQGAMNGGLLKSRIVDSLADLADLNKYSKVEISSPSDLVVNTTTEKVEVVSQTVDLSDLKTYGDAHWKTAEGFASAADVKASENAVLSEMETLATAVSAQDIQTVSNEIKAAVETVNTSVNAIASDVDKVETYTDQLEGMVAELPTSSGIASAVWSHDSRDLTRYEIADLSGVAKTSDLVNVAKSSEVEAAKSAILAGCRTAEGFATSQEVEAAKEAILTDCATATGFATPEDVISAAELVPENVWNYGTDFNARTVKANGVSLDGTDLSVQVDSAEIANAVWTRTVRTLTSGDNIDFPEFDTSVLDTLATSAEIQAIADGRKLTDLAVPADLVVNTTTETVEVISQTVDLADLKTYGDVHWKTAEGFATPANVTAAQNTIVAQCATATGFATPEDVKLTTTTETVEVISQTVDLSGIPASVWNYGTIADRVVTAGSVEISGDVQVDASSIAAAVWSSPERELTQNVAAPADVNSAKMEILSSCATASGFAKPADVVSAKNEIVEKCATATGFATVAGLSAAKNEILTNCTTASGFATPANVTAARDSILSQCRTATGFATPADVKLTTTTQTVDLTDLKTYGDAHWKTAEGFARAETVDPALDLISALIKRWKVSGSTLTAYGNSGEVLGTFTLVKDTSGNIIEVR